MNYTFNQSIVDAAYSFNQTCITNQYAVIEATKKLPIIALWLSIAIFILLAFIWLVLPFIRTKINEEQWKDTLIGITFVTSIWLPLILMYFTLDFNEIQLKKLETILFIGAAILALITIYWNRRNIKKWLQTHNLSDQQ